MWEVGGIFSDQSPGDGLQGQVGRRPDGGVTVPRMPTLPGAATTALRDLLRAPEASARVVGVHPSCVYVVTADELVTLEAADALGLPCSVRLGVDRSRRPFAGVRLGDRAVVGGGRVVAGPLTIPVVRWRLQRRPRRGPFAEARVEALARLMAAHPAPVPVDGSVRDLLGLGPGLTPAGDDVLAGMLVAVHSCEDLRAPLAAETTRLAPGRTTTLSAALLRHAADGAALPAVLDVADALTGHGSDADLARALTRLVAVGHSSGAALAHGLLRGARTVAGRAEEAA